MLQETPRHFVYRTQVKWICEETLGVPCWKARALVGTSAQHNYRNHPARQPAGQKATKPPDKKKLARQYTRMDTSRPTNPATHSRGHTTMASTVNE